MMVTKLNEDFLANGRFLFGSSFHSVLEHRIINEYFTS